MFSHFFGLAKNKDKIDKSNIFPINPVIKMYWMNNTFPLNTGIFINFTYLFDLYNIQEGKEIFY